MTSWRFIHVDSLPKEPKRNVGYITKDGNAWYDDFSGVDGDVNRNPYWKLLCPTNDSIDGIDINLFDTSFAHTSHSVPGKMSSKINWLRSHHLESCDNFYVNEQCLRDDIKDGSYGMILESQAIIPGIYDRIHRNISKFKLFFTHSSELLRYKNSRWIPGGSCWIDGDYGGGEYKIYSKTKNISMVSSNKAMCPLHVERSDTANLLKSLNIDVDIFGTVSGGEWTPIIKSLEDYRFSIVVENFIDDSPYFTEKILNCFATGTIPVYRGPRNISKFFNENGIVFLDKSSDIFEVLPTLNEDFYYSRMDSIKENLELSKQFDVLEDFIFSTYLIKEGNK